MQQFNNLIEFRQNIYDHVLTKCKDAQFEPVDALLLSAPIHSFPELTCSPAFRRQWHSAYTAVEDGRQDQLDHLQRISDYLNARQGGRLREQIPTSIRFVRCLGGYL
jgi:hypothetical protein